jgi:hypothetical protein
MAFGDFQWGFAEKKNPRRGPNSFGKRLRSFEFQLFEEFFDFLFSF